MLKRKEFWGTIIALILLAYCVKDIRVDDLRSLYSRISFYYLIPALLMEFILIISKAVRWGTIIENSKKLSIFRVCNLYSAGQVINIIMPALTGQMARIWLFSRKVGLTKAYVFSTILLEVLFDAISLLAMIVIVSMAFAFPEEYRPISYVIAFITISMFVILYLILTFKKQIGALGRKTLRRRSPKIFLILKKFADSFTKGISLLRSTKYFFRTMALSLAGWLAHILVVYFLFKSFGFYDLPFMAAIIIMVINTLALLIPITPGNAGTFELAVVASLLVFNIAKSDAVLYALALHLLDLIPIFVMGFLFLRSERMTLKEIKEEGEKEEIPEEFDEREESLVAGDKA